MIEIHKTAIVHPQAKLAEGVEIGAYTTVGEHVVLGENVKVGSHCVLTGRTTIGRNTEIFTGVVIGSDPQDRKYNPAEKVYLEIGQENIFREYVTVNPGTAEGGKTVIGNQNLFMAYAHVAHDCVVGNSCVMANVATLAGHVTLEDGAVVGGLAAVHQFVRLGKMSIVGGCSKVVQDIPPYSLCDGHPARVYGLNLVGLKRAKWSTKTIQLLRTAFKILFHSGLLKPHAIAKVQKELPKLPEIEYLLHFIQTSKRGVCAGKRNFGSGTEI